MLVEVSLSRLYRLAFAFIAKAKFCRGTMWDHLVKWQNHDRGCEMWTLVGGTSREKNK